MSEGRRTTWLVWCLGVGCALGVAQVTRGQNYPLLEEINRQTQSLYQDVQSGIVRVQLPVPRWVQEAAATDDPLRRWEQVMDPAVKLRLDHQRQQVNRGVPVRVSSMLMPPAATTRPDTRPATRKAGSGVLGPNWVVTRRPGSNETVLEPRAGAGGGGSSVVIHAGGDVTEEGNLNLGGPLRLRIQAADGFAPNNIGLILDDAGHVIVPLYVERETLGDEGVAVMVQDVRTTARFVGSDDKTNLTILKLEKPVGRAVRMARSRPAEGSLVMMLNPGNGTGRLSLWTANEREYGVVVSMDGSVAGVARYGQFLGGPAAQVVVEQLIKGGSVRRGVLGARLTEVRQDERGQRAGVAARAGLLVDEVVTGSVAERVGLRRGDLIVQVNDVPVVDLTTFAALSARPGVARLGVVRGGERIEVGVEFEVNGTVP